MLQVSSVNQVESASLIVRPSGCWYTSPTTKSSKNLPGAQKFLAFLVSKQGQEIIAHSISFEYPLDDGVQTTAPETPFADLQPNSISIADLADGSAAISLLRQAGLL